MPNGRRSAWWAGLVVVAAGCLTPDPPAAQSCTSCHGGVDGPAPPIALGGVTDPAFRGVGAHQAHLAATGGVPVECEACHAVPATVDAEGHVDTPWPAEVAWGGGIGGAGAQPFDPDQPDDALTCAVYCHGATLTGGSNTAPVWSAGAGQAACGTCHGTPPPPPHPSGATCIDCHPSAGDPTRHVNGTLELDGGGTTPDPESCTDCHGAGADPAPPPDTSGSSDTSRASVGAHATHGAGGASSAPVACADCHVVPTATDDPGHIDPSPAEVVFAGAAIAANHRDAAYDPASATCADTACHARGGTNEAPTWNVVDGSQAPCGACHALPPPPPAHPANAANCQACHPDAGPSQTISDPASHVDGKVDL